MKSANHNNKGFSIIEVMILVVLIAVICLLGYRVMSKSDSEQSSTGVQESAQSQEVEPVFSSEDLDKSVKQLEAVDLDTQDDEQQLKALAQ